jgi:glutaredoxin/predicted small secreted protein
MRASARSQGFAAVLACLFLLATGLLLAGCTTTPGGGQPVATTTTPSLPSYVVHVTGGINRGFVLLVGMSTCPHCQAAKALLANMSIDYYWIDLNTLSGAENTEVLQALRVCKDTQFVPMLIVRGETCIIGDNETEIREALK